MAQRIRLAPGRYRADESLTVMLMHNTVEKEWRSYPCGTVFVIPETEKEFWYAVVYYPDLGDRRPQFTRSKS